MTSIRFLAMGSAGLGVVSFLWFVFFVLQELMPMPVHIPRRIAVWVGFPLTLALPIAAIVLGLMATVKMRAQVGPPMWGEQSAATTGVVLGGVVLFLCLLLLLWILTLPT